MTDVENREDTPAEAEPAIAEVEASHRPMTTTGSPTSRRGRGGSSPSIDDVEGGYSTIDEIERGFETIAAFEADPLRFVDADFTGDDPRAQMTPDQMRRS